MSINLSKHKEELLFIPLGGAGEIGMNLNLYHYRGKWLIVDFGVGFADSYLPGVDMIAPDISFLIKHKKDIVGMVITHAHEDHAGAVPYLWQELCCPIYTTPFTACFLRAKVAEMSFAKEIVIHEIKTGGKVELKPFAIEMVPLCHSAPEMQSLVIKTDLGNVLHTGDWKFDHDPLIGDANDEAVLKSYGDQGILAMVGDSTNIFNMNNSGSEGDLRESLINLIAKCPKMVVVTTFSSNVARIESIIRAAEKCGRRVVLAGRSLWRIVECAKDSGYLKDIPSFVDDKNMGDHPRDKLLVIATGCQGEPLAATNKFASKAHPHIKLALGDTVIFSSKIIPGNDKRIYRLFNQFISMGVEVLTERDHFVHVSGHPGRDDLTRMYQLIRPEIAIPVHGELIHMHEHVNFAKQLGVPHQVQINNGDVLRLAPGLPEKLAVVESGYLAIDGNYLLPIDSPVMRMRRKLQRDGIILITMNLSVTGQLLTAPIIFCPGSLDEKEDADIFAEMSDAIAEGLEQQQKASKGKSGNDSIMNVVRTAVRRIVRREIGKNPLIEVKINRL